MLYLESSLVLSSVELEIRFVDRVGGGGVSCGVCCVLGGVVSNGSVGVGFVGGGCVVVGFVGVVSDGCVVVGFVSGGCVWVGLVGDGCSMSCVFDGCDEATGITLLFLGLTGGETALLELPTLLTRLLRSFIFISVKQLDNFNKFIEKNTSWSNNSK